MKKEVISGSLHQSSQTFESMDSKKYERVSINNNEYAESEDKPNTKINKISALNYFAGTHYLFYPKMLTGNS